MHKIETAAILLTSAILAGCEIIPIVSGEYKAATCQECMGDIGKYKVDPDDYPTYTTDKEIKTPQRVNRKWAIKEDELNSSNPYYYYKDTSTSQFFKSGYHQEERISILPTDKWVVTYSVNGVYIIESEDYNDRICRYFDEKYPDSGPHKYGWVNFFNSCLLNENRELGIFIYPDGRLAGGWVGVRFHTGTVSYDKTILRIVRFEPDDDGNNGWPTGKVFYDTTSHNNSLNMDTQ